MADSLKLPACDPPSEKASPLPLCVLPIIGEPKMDTGFVALPTSDPRRCAYRFSSIWGISETRVVCIAICSGGGKRIVEERNEGARGTMVS